MKITKLKPGESAFPTEISDQLRRIIDTETTYCMGDYGKSIVRIETEYICSCKSKENRSYHETKVDPEGICKSCGYYASVREIV